MSEEDYNKKLPPDKYSEALSHIVGMVGGVDGGHAYCKLEAMIASLRRQAHVGNEQAVVVLDIVIKFSRLIRIAEKGHII